MRGRWGGARIARMLASLQFAIGIAAVVLGGRDADNFDPENAVEGVRVLAIQANKPFAQPGDSVQLTLLAADGRPPPSNDPPMQVYWVPIICQNPASDSYYNCFSSASSSSAISFTAPVGTDLTSQLITGSQFSFEMPSTIISDHPVIAGSAAPYGLVIVFAIACAGHVELTTTDVSNLQSIPIGCFGDNHVALEPNDYAIAFTRVYAFTQFSNANPVIDSVSLGGVDVNVAAGISLARCTNSSGCNLQIGVQVPASSQETYVAESSGATTREQLWVDYYTSLNQFDTDSLLLYDPVAGAVSGSTANYQIPSSPGQGVMWVVVRDNRGGVDWVQFPVYVE